jgi:hypothetical protein
MDSGDFSSQKQVEVERAIERESLGDKIGEHRRINC